MAKILSMVVSWPSNLFIIVRNSLRVKWRNTLVPEHYGKSYQWEKNYCEVTKQMSFLRDILLPASVLFPVMHTQT